MSTNVNLAAPIVRKRGRAKVVVVVTLVIAGAYLAAMLAFSLAGREKVLARGEEKHFCEIDCHLAYSVVDTRQSKTLGDPPNQEAARGVYTIIKIKTRFDETTIAQWRGNGLLYPNSRVLTVVDERGNQYMPSSQSGTPLTNPLRPGESYTTDAVFDLPANAKPMTLLINEGDLVTRLVIGHENSPLHKKTSFQIDVSATPLAIVESLGSPERIGR